MILRDQLPSDVDRFVYWQTHGEWLEFDAPWEGFGETLKLEFDYLFANSDFKRIALGTWSFTPRMMIVAKKVGFTPEGAERELRQWQSQWIDLVHYGMLRREWEPIGQYG